MSKVRNPEQLTSKAALIIRALIGLVLGAAVFLRAFDTGSLWQYLIAFIFFVLAGGLLTRAFKTKK